MTRASWHAFAPDALRPTECAVCGRRADVHADALDQLGRRLAADEARAARARIVPGRINSRRRRKEAVR